LGIALIKSFGQERVLNPTYSLQYRRAVTLPDKMEQLRTVLDSLPLTTAESDAIVAKVRAVSVLCMLCVLTNGPE
jgi:hypothetical protein